MPTAAPRYVARKISDPRSRGACYWFDVERIDADGRRSWVATVDDRAEARDMIRRLVAHDARQAEAAAALAAARAAAAPFQAARRHAAARITGDALARVRSWSPSLVADRLAIAQAIRAARSAVRR